MHRIIALVLVSIMAFLLVGCEAIKDVIDYIPGKNPTGNPDAKYWGYVFLESDEELSRLWDIRKSSLAKDGKECEKLYSFDDNALDVYKTVYYFEAPNAWVTYPISLDDYFADVRAISEASYVIDTDAEYCDCGSSTHEAVPYVPEEQSDYLKYPLISISRSKSLDNAKIIAIEDSSLITYSYELGWPSGHKYVCSYNGEEAFVINSCRELSQDTLARLFEHIIVVE